MVLREQVKLWVVKNASVTNPYKKYWSASVTIMGMDENGIGATIEKAYLALVAGLYNNKHYINHLDAKIKKENGQEKKR